MSSHPHSNIPMVQKPITARSLAFAILDEQQRTSAFASQLLDRQLEATALSDADRRLTTELVYGIVRRRATLDAIIAAHVTRPRHRVEESLWTLLQLGTYQQVLSTGIPDHAAVFETVELAKGLGKANWAGFMNGVLRQIGRALTDVETSKPAANAVPLTAGKYRKLAVPVFADPRDRPVDYLAQAFSFPEWLIDRWVARFGFEQVVRLAFWFNAAQSIFLRVNPLKVSRDTLLASLTGAGHSASAGVHPQSIRVELPARIPDLPGYQEGFFSVQDESAMAVGSLLSPRPGEQVLDLCAAPGGKTTHLAELMQDQGHILATDVERHRLSMVEEGSRRLGLQTVQTRLIGPDGHDLPQESFDAILVDAPCSNTGVLGKRPEARWRIGTGHLKELAELQQRLLSVAASRLKENGRLVYSTCSIEPEENEKVILAFLRKNPTMTLIDQALVMPGRPADGGFRALLQRTARKMRRPM